MEFGHDHVFSIRIVDEFAMGLMHVRGCPLYRLELCLFGMAPDTHRLVRRCALSGAGNTKSNTLSNLVCLTVMFV